MKRLITALVLIALALTIGITSKAAVTNRASSLIGELERTLTLLEAGRMNEARAQAVSGFEVWKKSRFSFLVYLDHDTFSELEYLFPSLSEYISIDRKQAAMELRRASAVLQDVIGHQKLRLGNIL